MLIGFILGLMVGGTIGVLTAAWCVAASRSDESTRGDDTPDDADAADAAGAGAAASGGYQAGMRAGVDIPVVPMADMPIANRYRDPVDELELPPPEYPRGSRASFPQRGPEAGARG
jgi:hypothetical protein